MDIPLIKPKKVTVESIDGDKKEFTISRMPAFDGHEVATQYLEAHLPKIGTYAMKRELMQKLMNYVEVDIEGQTVRLDSIEFINNHVSDWEMLNQLEDEMIDYNTSFLASGKGSIISQICEQAAKLFLTQMSVESSEQ